MAEIWCEKEEKRKCRGSVEEASQKDKEKKGRADETRKQTLRTNGKKDRL